jgi:DNA-binding CsgD family transcriptional regulator
MAEPLVGRAEQLAALADLERRVEGEGRPGAVLVLGPPGQGKSRLLAEARARTRARVLTMVGYEPEREVPLGAASELLRRLAAVPGEGRPLAALLSGELGAGGTLESVRLFEAAHRARRALGSTLVTIDDVQWVDGLSLALCHYLVRAAASVSDPLAVVAASRPSPAASNFAASIGERLAGGLGLTIVELPALDEADSLRLLRAVAPDLSPARAEQIVGQAAGSPFWIRALAQGRAGLDAATVISVRLGAAGGDARALVAALAVAGRPLSSADLEELMEWPPDRVAAAIRDVEARGLAIAAGGGVSLAHDLIRETAVGGLTGAARRGLHRRLAARLEREAGDDLTLLQAALGHQREAGETPLDLALRIADSPRRRLLRGARLVELADIAADADPDAPEAAVLADRVARLASEIGDHERALDLWRRLAERQPDPQARLEATVAAGWAAHALGGARESRALIARARAARPGGPLAIELDALEAVVLISLENRVRDGRSLAAAAAGAAREMAAAAGGPERLDRAARAAHCAALRAAFDAALRFDQSEAIVAIADEMVEAARGFDEQSYLDALRHGGIAAYESGNLIDAEPRLRRVWEEAGRRVLPAVEVRAGGYLARTLLAMGCLDETESVIDRLRTLGDRADLPGWRHLPRVRCEVDLLRGDPERACRDLAALAAGEANPHARLRAQRRLLEWHARVAGGERAEEVRRLLGDARESARAAGCVTCSADLDVEAAEALARIGMTDDARRSPALRAHARAGSYRALRRRWVAALADLGSGEERAVPLLEQVVRDAERLSRRLDALWAGLDLARGLAVDDRDRAVATLRGVAAGADRIGSTTHAALARRQLRRLGVREWRPSTGAPSRPLSPRELEIALLAAGGASNPEIASAVFLSRKTVERHVSTALAKLGARNRTELAGHLVELERLREAGRAAEGPPS